MKPLLSFPFFWSSWQLQSASKALTVRCCGEQLFPYRGWDYDGTMSGLRPARLDLSRAIAPCRFLASGCGRSGMDLGVEYLERRPVPARPWTVWRCGWNGDRTSRIFCAQGLQILRVSSNLVSAEHVGTS
ncbi:hypothetical protein L227DRAFT_395976 [Lentinus tigrinus ALCF2SS1-6]|uniref:Uncharacterized protein n=1 Tax=Lentinus tigrinus ALCF2SS1-6 TaxID=1328759 RepID=A0A5C2RQJ8_9APHY|nr:hypothetical protein L227DRAFT_395976 [Lentinus tigrinus ALCF2SS1-6]